MQASPAVYGIAVPPGWGSPDITLTLQVLNGTTDVGIFCNPGWGQFILPQLSSFPHPTFSKWQSDQLLNGTISLNISANDINYRPPDALNSSSAAYASYQPYFICAVRGDQSLPSKSASVCSFILAHARRAAPPSMLAPACSIHPCQER
jgi:hypothetical protein